MHIATQWKPLSRSLLTWARALGLSGLGSVGLAADAPPRAFSQDSEVVPSKARGESAAVVAASVSPAIMKAGPPAQWIWGAKEDHRYVLRKQFPGGAAAARLLASCDNTMTITLNGRRVGEGKDWAQPVDLDVQNFLRPGANDLAVSVANEGAVAGFALKLALTDRDGATRYVVTDESWRATERAGSREGVPVRVLGAMGMAPWSDVFAQAIDTPREARDVFEVPKGFRVERLFTVPREELGSWVNLTFDPKGRLIVSDQDSKGLCRVTPAPPSGGATKVERLDLPITSAQGLLFAFGSLYISVNGDPQTSGLYRAKYDADADRFGPVEKLSVFRGGGEHGPHALRLSPDGKSILVICGNHTLPPEKIDASRVPRNWGEDLLLPRDWDANGHARGILAPGGWIARTDPDGKTWEMESIGYRNPFDMAFNADGELFAYDADMEWDIGMPWYRPTRVVHASSGSEFGWRSGTGKWPTTYLDSLPPAVNIGPGSPVGVSFGYGAKFPARYQKALFACDWTFGTMYALHFEPDGASYRATKEEFVSRTPLPLTDLAVGPDGALYFTIGGRKTQSELFRVTYTGTESTAPVDGHDAGGAEARALRRRLEAFHRPADDPVQAVAAIYPNLGHADRFIRYAARVALEHQATRHWQEKVLAETSPEALVTGAVALARQGDKALEPRLLEVLGRVDFKALDESLKLELLRSLSLVFIRMGQPDPASKSRWISALDPQFPGANDAINRELANVLVYLEAPGIVTKLIDLLKQPRGAADDVEKSLLARNPEYGRHIAQMQANRPDAQKIHYAFVLRNLREGWTIDQRKFYFTWLREAEKWQGGASYVGFLRNIGNEAYENASDAERLAVEVSGVRKPAAVPELPKPQGPGHTWTLDEVLAATKSPLTHRNFANGRKVFAAARCVQCHRFGGEGGATGPDLTQAAGRFGPKDLAEAILDPSKVVSDQYRASVVATNTGKVHTGRIVGETPTALTVLIDPEDATKVVEVPRSEIDEIQASKTSVMPEGLLNPLNPDEVLDLMAYVLSRGNEADPAFGAK